MNTFNLGLVFDNGKIVCVIVCHSETNIDRNFVSNVASKYLSDGLNTKKTIKEVLDLVIEGLKKECELDAVLVNADVSCVIPMK